MAEAASGPPGISAAHSFTNCLFAFTLSNAHQVQKTAKAVHLRVQALRSMAHTLLAQKWEGEGGKKQDRGDPERPALCTLGLRTALRSRLPCGETASEARLGGGDRRVQCFGLPAEWSPSPSQPEWKWVFTRQIDESHLLTSDLPGLRSGWYSRRGGRAAKISREGLRKAKNSLHQFTRLLSDGKFCSCEKSLHFSRRSAPFDYNHQEPKAGRAACFPSLPFSSFISRVGKGGRRVLKTALWASAPAMENRALKSCVRQAAAGGGGCRAGKLLPSRNWCKLLKKRSTSGRPC